MMTVFIGCVLLTSGFLGDTVVIDDPILFIRSDANSDSRINIADVVTIVGYITGGKDSPAPRCLDALDVDDGGTVVLNDALYLVRYLFLGGPEPLPPFKSQGLFVIGYDPTIDDLR